MKIYALTQSVLSDFKKTVGVKHPGKIPPFTNENGKKDLFKKSEGEAHENN